MKQSQATHLIYSYSRPRSARENAAQVDSDHETKLKGDEMSLMDGKSDFERSFNCLTKDRCRQGLVLVTGEGHSGERESPSPHSVIFNTAKLVAALLMLMPGSPRETHLATAPHPKGRNGRRGAETSVATDTSSIEIPPRDRRTSRGSLPQSL